MQVKDLIARLSVYPPTTEVSVEMAYCVERRTAKRRQRHNWCALNRGSQLHRIDKNCVEERSGRDRRSPQGSITSSGVGSEPLKKMYDGTDEELTSKEAEVQAARKRISEMVNASWLQDECKRIGVEIRTATPEEHEAEPTYLVNVAAEKARKWEEAVEEACIVNCIGFYKDDPNKSLAKLIGWEVKIALDPQVSKQAHDMLEAARKEEALRVYEECAQIAHVNHEFGTEHDIYELAEKRRKEE